MTPFLSLRAAQRSAVLEDVPEGWEAQVFEPSLEGDALTWLGFESGEPDEPLLAWPRPQRMPGVWRRRVGRHHPSAPFRTA